MAVGHLYGTGDEEIRGRLGVDAVLFLSLFAAQAGLIVVQPVLAQIASDFSVATATAGQLRAVSGLAAGIMALVVAPLAGRLGLRELLLGATGLLALGSLASAIAPSLLILALIQVGIGVAIGVLLTAGTSAAGEWVAPEQGARALSWALSGQAAGWVVGMPLIGIVGEMGWRYAWLAFPFVASLLAALALSRAAVPRESGSTNASVAVALADRRVRLWAVGELLASSAWAGTLVFAGALFTESYEASLPLTGLLLAPAGLAVIAGNVVFRRLVSCEPGRLLVRLALILAVLVPIFGAVRCGIVVSAVLFTVASFLAGGRMLIGNAFGLQMAPRLRLAVMGTRASANQFGYFIGAAIGGLALGSGGYGVLGLTLGALFLGAALAVTTTTTTGLRAGRHSIAEGLNVPARPSVAAFREALIPRCLTQDSSIKKGAHP
jgi:DHA1 family inner membrane transport protein